MPSPHNRAPLLLALVVVLGVGGRLLRVHAQASTAAPAPHDALDQQLARVERAAQASRSRAGPGSTRTAARSGASRATGAAVRSRPSNRQRPLADPSTDDSPEAVRTERTPLGAIPPNVLGRYLASTGRSVEFLDPGRIAVRSAEDGAVRSAGGARGRERERARLPTVVDVEVATEKELERLPRIGPALARRIVEDRKAHGPFRTLQGLQRVRGVGPATAKLLEGRVTFGGAGRP